MARLTDFGAIRSVFANADFRNYTGGNFFSHVALWLQRVTVAWLTWELTGSPFWLGFIAFADFAPAVVLAPIAGAIADRVDRLKGIRVTQSLAVLQCAALAALTWTDAITIEVLLGLTFALGCVMAFNQPLRLAAIPSLVERKDMSAAVSVNALSFNVGRIAGPAIGGAVIVWFGMAPCFALCALLYLAFILALVMMRNRVTRPEGSSKPLASIPGEIRDGFRYCIAHEGIAPVLILMLVISVLGRAYIELLPGFVADVWGYGAEGLAMLTSALGAGAIVGTLVLATRPSVAGLTRFVVLNVLLFGAGVVGFAFAPTIWIAMALVAVNGYASIIVGVGEQTLLQSAVAGAMRGRVMSLYGMITRAGPAIGALGMGSLSEVFGLRWPVVGGAIAVLALWLWLRPRRDRMAAALEGEPAEPATVRAG